MGRQLAGATLGIWATGDRGVARENGVALGMRVLVADPFKTIVEKRYHQVGFPTRSAQSPTSSSAWWSRTSRPKT